MAGGGHGLAAAQMAATPSRARSAVRGMAAAALAGLSSAVLTRLLMRVVEVLTNGTPRFSLGGLVAIISFYVLCLLPGCIALALFRAGLARRWSWVLFVAGAGFLCYMAVNIGVQETQDSTGMTPIRWLALTVALVAMLLVYAAQVVAASRWARGLPWLHARRTVRGQPTQDDRDASE